MSGRVTFDVTQDRLSWAGPGGQVTYGVLGLTEDGYSICVPDISTVRARVEALVERLNRLEVSRYHVLEVVLDSLEE